MSRRRRAEKREILPDPKFKDLVLSKFMNNLMLDGKKSVSEKIVYGAFDEIENKMKRPALEVFHEALDGTAFSCRIASLKQHDHPFTTFFHPFLYFEQLHLQLMLMLFVKLTRYFALVRVFTGTERLSNILFVVAHFIQ